MGFISCASPPCKAVLVHSRSAKADLRPDVATHQTRSVHAVSHDSDGFLRARPRGFVAPRCRPWGSPCFRSAATSRGCSVGPSPKAFHPSKLFPPRQPSRVTQPPEGAGSPRCGAFSPFQSGSACACRHAQTSAVSRPQGFEPSRSPLPPEDVAIHEGLDAPMGFGLTQLRLRFGRPPKERPADIAIRHRSASRDAARGPRSRAGLNGSYPPPARPKTNRQLRGLHIAEALHHTGQDVAIQIDRPGC